MTYLYPASPLAAFFIKVGANRRKAKKIVIQAALEGPADLSKGAISWEAG
jgi:hypothetical protein